MCVNSDSEMLKHLLLFFFILYCQAMRSETVHEPFCDLQQTVFCGIISDYIIVGVFTKYDQLAGLPEKYWDNDFCKMCFLQALLSTNTSKKFY